MKNIDDQILAKYFAHKADERELGMINDWIEQDETHLKTLEQYHKIWLLSQKNEDFNPDVNAAWRKVKLKTAAQKPKNSLLAIAASLAAILLLGMVWYQFAADKPSKMLSIKTDNESKELTLSDGSRITLNSFSMLEYPESFSKNGRDVKLTGEAFFEISPDPSKPFVILANGSEVKVLGTSFVIKARDKNVQVSVNTGTVLFKTSNEQEVKLVKNQEAQYLAESDTIKVKLILDKNVFAFKTKIFDFDKTELSSVINQLNEAYQADIKLDNAILKKQLLTARFENEPLSNVLDIIAETFELELEVKEKSYYFKKKSIVQ